MKPAYASTTRVSPSSTASNSQIPGRLINTSIALSTLIVVGCTTLFAGANTPEDSPIRFPSPDKRFALRISEAQDKQDGDTKIDIIEAATGKVVADLGAANSSSASRSVLIWSANSKWVAYGTGGDRQRETGVYFWNGSAFEEIPLPEELPAPQIKFPKSADGPVKNYGGGETPVRWLKSGELEISSESVMMSRVDDRTYTGTVLITIAFDTQHHASIKSISKSKTKVE
jgi:hypothetical protein